MRKLITVIFVLVLAFSFQSVFAQKGFVLNGSGARAAGMGYAFTGISDDATAISWNSAGLTQLGSMEASVVGRMGFGSLDVDDDDISVETSSKFQLNFASFVFPFSTGGLTVVGGVAYRRIYDFTEEFTFKYQGGFTDFVYKEENTGGIDAITPAIGIALNEMISVGAAFNIITGATDYKTTSEVGSISTDSSFTEEYSGTAIDIGILLRPTPQFSIGANLNLPHVLKVNDGMFEYEFEVPMFFSVGAAVRAGDNMTIAFDYRSRPWSNAKLMVDDFELDLGAEDANSIHVGLEYLFQGSNSVLPFRLGYFTQPTINTDLDDEQIVYSGLSAGLGIVMNNFIIDGSVEYVFGTYAGDYDAFGELVDYNSSDLRISIGGVIHIGY